MKLRTFQHHPLERATAVAAHGHCDRAKALRQGWQPLRELCQKTMSVYGDVARTATFSAIDVRFLDPDVRAVSTGVLRATIDRMAHEMLTGRVEGEQPLLEQSGEVVVPNERFTCFARFEPLVGQACRAFAVDATEGKAEPLADGWVTAVMSQKQRLSGSAVFAEGQLAPLDHAFVFRLRSGAGEPDPRQEEDGDVGGDDLIEMFECDLVPLEELLPEEELLRSQRMSGQLGGGGAHDATARLHRVLRRVGTLLGSAFAHKDRYFPGVRLPVHVLFAACEGGRKVAAGDGPAEEEEPSSNNPIGGCIPTTDNIPLGVLLRGWKELARCGADDLRWLCDALQNETTTTGGGARRALSTAENAERAASIFLAFGILEEGEEVAAKLLRRRPGRRPFLTSLLEAVRGFLVSELFTPAVMALVSGLRRGQAMVSTRDVPSADLLGLGSTFCPHAARMLREEHAVAMADADDAHLPLICARDRGAPGARWEIAGTWGDASDACAVAAYVGADREVCATEPELRGQGPPHDALSLVATTTTTPASSSWALVLRGRDLVGLVFEAASGAIRSVVLASLDPPGRRLPEPPLRRCSWLLRWVIPDVLLAVVPSARALSGEEAQRGGDRWLFAVGGPTLVCGGDPLRQEVDGGAVFPFSVRKVHASIPLGDLAAETALAWAVSSSSSGGSGGAAPASCHLGSIAETWITADGATLWCKLGALLAQRDPDAPCGWTVVARSAEGERSMAAMPMATSPDDVQLLLLQRQLEEGSREQWRILDVACVRTPSPSSSSSAQVAVTILLFDASVERYGKLRLVRLCLSSRAPGQGGPTPLADRYDMRLIDLGESATLRPHLHVVAAARRQQQEGLGAEEEQDLVFLVSRRLTRESPVPQTAFSRVRNLPDAATGRWSIEPFFPSTLTIGLPPGRGLIGLGSGGGAGGQGGDTVVAFGHQGTHVAEPVGLRVSSSGSVGHPTTPSPLAFAFAPSEDWVRRFYSRKKRFGRGFQPHRINWFDLAADAGPSSVDIMRVWRDLASGLGLAQSHHYHQSPQRGQQHHGGHTHQQHPSTFTSPPRRDINDGTWPHESGGGAFLALPDSEAAVISALAEMDPARRRWIALHLAPNAGSAGSILRHALSPSAWREHLCGADAIDPELWVTRVDLNREAFSGAAAAPGRRWDERAEGERFMRRALSALRRVCAEDDGGDGIEVPSSAAFQSRLKALHAFWTGSGVVTPERMRAAVYRVEVVGRSENSANNNNNNGPPIPRAHTCGRLICIPRLCDDGDLRDMIRVATNPSNWGFEFI